MSWCPAGRRVAVLAVVVIACGPAVVVPMDATSTSTTDAASSSGGAMASTSGATSVEPSVTSGESTTAASADFDGSDTSTGDGCSFLASCSDLDGGEGACDLFAQDCPPGEKCMPWANDGVPGWNATRCSPIDPDPVQGGEACVADGSGNSGIDNCDIGLMCWNVDEMGVGVCEHICTGTLDAPVCEDPEDACLVTNEGFIALCLETCHPLLQDCEIGNEACYSIAGDWFCFVARGSHHGASHGLPCDQGNGCEQGHACLASPLFSDCSNPGGCCAAFCDVFDPESDAMCSALDPAQTCEPWYVEGGAPAGYENVGVCIIAASP